MKDTLAARRGRQEGSMRFDNILDSVGRTPLVRLSRVISLKQAEVFLKMESHIVI